MKLLSITEFYHECAPWLQIVKVMRDGDKIIDARVKRAATQFYCGQYARLELTHDELTQWAIREDCRYELQEELTRIFHQQAYVRIFTAEDFV